MVVNNAKPPILADCCSIYSGFAFKSEDLNAEGNGFPVIKIGEIQNGTVSEPTNSFFPEDLFVNKLQKYILKSGDTLIAMTGAGSVGRVGRMPTVTKPYLVNQRVAIVRPDEEVVHTKFIYYFLSQEFIERSLYDLGLGAGQPNISADDIGRTPIPLPPLPIQKKIAAILSAYDELIENNNRRIALLEKMAEEIYREWFVRMRFPGHEKTRFHKGIPEGWEVKKLGEVVEYQVGGGWGQETPLGAENQAVHIIRGTDFKNIHKGDYSTTPCRFEKQSSIDSRKLTPGDIVLENSVNAQSRCSGNSIYITKEILQNFESPVIPASFCKVIRLNDPLLAYYVWKCMDYAYRQGVFEIFQNVATNGIANFQIHRFLERFIVRIPGDSILINELMSFDAKILTQQNTLLKQTRDALLPRLMSGKLDVENLDIAFPPGMQN
jgi:type I restriction enzyme S subunit